MFPKKKLFNNFLVAKDERIVKMVDDSACEVISTGTIKVTERDGTVRALEAVRYVLEARYYLISIRVLDEKKIPDPNATRRRHSQPRRQGNPERRESVEGYTS